MIARPEFHQSTELRKLYGRDAYRGEFQPAVAAPHEPVVLLEVRRADPGVLLTLQDPHGLRAISVSAPDDPRLSVLAATDRALVQAALTAIAREVPNADA